MEGVMSRIVRMPTKRAWIAATLTCVVAALHAQSALPENLRLSGTLQLRWSDREGRADRDGFEMRLARLAADFRPRPELSARIMVEFAGGERGQNAELRDAFATWQANPRMKVHFGQKLLELFYDVRERRPGMNALERAEVANTYFSGSRSRGVSIDYELAKGYTLQAGVWNSLTTGDPQLTGRGAQASVMTTLNLRGERANHQFNLGGMVGQRPGFQTRDAQNNPVQVSDTTRWLGYVENEFRNYPLSNVTLRWTLLYGRDRNPTGGVSNPQFLQPADYRANIIYGVYNLRRNQQLVLRWEDFDPDTDRRGDSIRTLGLFYHYYPVQGVRLTAGYEWVDAPNGRNRAYLAAQYQF